MKPKLMNARVSRSRPGEHWTAFIFSRGGHHKGFLREGVRPADHESAFKPTAHRRLNGSVEEIDYSGT